MSPTRARTLALRLTSHPTTRPLAALALVAGVLAALMAVPTSAHASPRHHRAHQHHGRHHHAGHHHRHHQHGHRHHHRRHHRAALGRSAGRVAHAMSIAVAQRGKPYAYGAAGPRSFDCSGLTSFAYHRAGFKSMPRTAAAQSHFARRIPRARMHRGDLIFFGGRGGVYHVGLYAGVFRGHRMVLHAPYPGQRVHAQPLWTNGWFAGTLRFR
jgi:cell wall-associated NlpC family hydrolase